MIQRNLLSVLLLVAPVIACGGDPDPLPTLSASANPTTFASGGTTMVSVAVEYFELVTEAPAQALRAAHGEGGVEVDDSGDEIVSSRMGHYHVYLDSFDTNPILMSGLSTTELTVTSTPGAHTLLFRLHGHDHKIVEPQISDRVDITLEAP